MKFNGLRAYVSVHRNADKQADAYGVTVRLDNFDYAICSAYLDEHTSINEAIRRALTWIASLRRKDGEGIAVYGHDAAFRYWKMKERVTGGIVSAKLHLFYMPADKTKAGSGLLADDAARRKTTITEIL
jgi:hypothetical protein